MNVMDKLQGRIIVSCQAYEGEALFGSDIMARMALAAKEGGASAIRANSPQDIEAIKVVTGLPVIGIWKRQYEDSDIYITPTLSDSLAVLRAGADIVAMDATLRARPGGQRIEAIVRALKSESDALLMADVSTAEEGLYAEQIGFDIVSTTLSGYTPYSPKLEGPDYGLLERLAGSLRIPVAAEGRIGSPDEAARCLELGAWFVVVGTAITRPWTLTEMFVRRAESAWSSLRRQAEGKRS